jgi:cytochrome c oxidase cbb3-type subunit IV
MFKNYLKGIDGIAGYPVISLLVFFLFFIALSVWVLRANKKRMQEISEMPLDSHDYSSSNGTPL